MEKLAQTKIESKEKHAWENIEVFRVRHLQIPYHEQLKGIPPIFYLTSANDLIHL